MENGRLFAFSGPEEGGEALVFVRGRKEASTTGEEHVPLKAWAATFTGLRLVHSSKSTTDRSASHNTACIGSKAGYAARCLHNRWLKSANALWDLISG